jgi:hypothetical protein
MKKLKHIIQEIKIEKSLKFGRKLLKETKEMLEKEYGIPNDPITTEDKNKLLEEIRKEYSNKPQKNSKESLFEHQKFVKDLENHCHQYD